MEWYSHLKHIDVRELTPGFTTRSRSSFLSIPLSPRPLYWTLRIKPNSSMPISTLVPPQNDVDSDSS
jgi:hypothetical protein